MIPLEHCQKTDNVTPFNVQSKHILRFHLK